MGIGRFDTGSAMGEPRPTPSPRGIPPERGLMVPVPQALSVSPDSTGICAGDTLGLHAKGTDVYQWIGDVAGLSSVTSGNPIAQPQTQQTVHYEVVGSDAYACFSDTAQITLTVKPLPTVN